jgi:hypothetical protein
MSSPIRILTPSGRENSIHLRILNVDVDSSDMSAGFCAGCLNADGGGSLRVRVSLGSVRGGHTGVFPEVMSEGQGLESMSREYSRAVDGVISCDTFIGNSFCSR